MDANSEVGDVTLKALNLKEKMRICYSLSTSKKARVFKIETYVFTARQQSAVS